MKIVFMGTPEMAECALDRIIRSNHEVAAVVTQPDKCSGRGRMINHSPVKKCAIENGLALLQPESVGSLDSVSALREISPDIIVVVAYAQKIPREILNMTRFGCINMHPSLLPKYRGAAPFRGPILNGDKETGVTIMQLSEEWDAGDILLQKSFDINEKDTAETIEKRAVPLGADMLIDVIDGLEKGNIYPVPQNDDEATYLRQIKKEDGLIDFSKPAYMIDRQIRACVPWPSAYTHMNGKIFKIWQAEPVDDPGDISAGEFECGTVVYADKNTVLIKCGEGILKIYEVQAEGKKRMQIKDFLMGNRLDAGYRFG